MQEWTKDALFYHIYPLGFCGAPQYHEEAIEHRLLKLKTWIPHLQDLYINALYLGPVFESFEHGYDTSDYRIIDHRLGTNDDFKAVCDALHEANIHIVLDGVFNHVGREFWAFKDVQQHLQASKYKDWFHHIRFDSSSPMGDPFTYEAWEGHYNLVKLNLQNEEVVMYLLESIGMWIDEFHVDGLRLDAADCIDPSFFKRLKQYCKQKKPGFWLMGEIIHGDYNRWANQDMLDTVTNYECYKGLYSAHNEKNYFEIAHSIQRQSGKGGIYESLNLYTFVDNHDVNRLASTVKDKKDLANIYTLLYTMPGIPSLYYGSEWGVSGKKHDGSDADIRPCLALEDTMYDTHLHAYLCLLGSLREQYSTLRYGRYEQVLVRNEQYVFKRIDDEEIVIALNVSDQPTTLDIPVSYSCVQDVLHDVSYSSDQHTIHVTIEPKQAVILVETQNDKKPTIKKEIKKEAPITIAEDNHAMKAQPSIPTEVTPFEADPELKAGKYEHYKGKHYAVLYVATHSETLEKFVVYRQLYGKGDVWIRPLSMFTETVCKDGKEVERFKYIGE